MANQLIKKSRIFFYDIEPVFQVLSIFVFNEGKVIGHYFPLETSCQIQKPPTQPICAGVGLCYYFLIATHRNRVVLSEASLDTNPAGFLFEYQTGRVILSLIIYGMSIAPQDFVSKWKRVTARERYSVQEHFIDLCALVGYETP